MKRFCCVVGATLLLAAATRAAPRPTTFPDLLAGKVAPLTLKLGDLDATWWRVGIEGAGAGGAGGPGAVSPALLMLGAAAGASPFYTRGETVSAEGEIYLVAYRAETKPIDWLALMRGGGRELPEPEKLTAETPLGLALVHLRTAGTLTGIRPFDLEREMSAADDAQREARQIFEEPRRRAVDASSTSNLRQIGLALAMYADLNNERLPVMTNSDTVKAALLGTVTQSDKIFVHPGTKEPYQPNPHMSGQPWQGNPDAVVFYEASPGADGGRSVLFNDGHVERVSKDKWAQLQKEFNLPVGNRSDDPTLEALRQLGVALIAYAGDGDKTLPPMETAAAVQKPLEPYAGKEAIFVDPQTKEPFQPNPSLAGKKLAAIERPAQTVAFYAARPVKDARAVLYLDGHVERLPETKWPALKKESRIP